MQRLLHAYIVFLVPVIIFLGGFVSHFYLLNHPNTDKFSFHKNMIMVFVLSLSPLLLIINHGFAVQLVYFFSILYFLFFSSSTSSIFFFLLFGAIVNCVCVIRGELERTRQPSQNYK
jgi:hypothetical protein